MNTIPLIMMLCTYAVIISITGYFFYRVLTTAPPDQVDEEDANFPRGG